MTVGIIVPSYRRPDSLMACLEGVLDGSTLPDEIVVVLRDIDTGSQSALSEWLEEGRADGRGVQVRKTIATRPGQIVAMNCGLEATDANIVCFTDDDCVPRKQWLENLLRHYADPNVGGVGGRDVVHVNGDISDGDAEDVGVITWCGRVIGNHHLGYEEGAVAVQHLKGANMSFRTKLMKPFDERMSGGSCCLNDTDASLHVASQGYRLIYDPEAIVDHFPADRFGASTRVQLDAELVYSDSHNWIYCLLKYFAPVRKCALLLYSLAVGSGNRHGVAKWLLTLPEYGTGTATKLLVASTRGKLAGLRSYLKKRQQQWAGTSDENCNCS